MGMAVDQVTMALAPLDPVRRLLQGLRVLRERHRLRAMAHRELPVLRVHHSLVLRPCRVRFPGTVQVVDLVVTVLVLPELRARRDPPVRRALLVSLVPIQVNQVATVARNRRSRSRCRSQRAVLVITTPRRGPTTNPNR